jgi:hypothetical protein
MSHGFIRPEILDDSIGDEKLRNSGALSVIGRSANSSGDPADISASTVGEALMYQSGATIGFDTASSFCGPQINRYHQDREPLTGLDTSCSDNFIGGSQLSWRWGNQGTSTVTDEMDSCLLTIPAGTGDSHRCRWITAPNAVDFIFTAKMSIMLRASNNACGIQLLSTGNETTPTTIDKLVYRARSLAINQIERGVISSYTAAIGSAVIDQISNGSNAAINELHYFQFRYTASSKALVAYYTTDGMTWKLLNSRTLAAHPISIGWHANANNSTNSPITRLHWFRTFTSGVNSATTDQYANGQVGS